MGDRDWEFITGIAQAHRIAPGHLARLMLTASPPPSESPTHEPYHLKLHLPDGKMQRLRSYACQRPPMPGVGKDACPFCAVSVIADASRCNLALGITDLAEHLRTMPVRERKSSIWFSHGVMVLVRAANR